MMDGKTRRPARFGQPDEAPAGSIPPGDSKPSTIPPTETAIARASDLQGPDKVSLPAVIEPRAASEARVSRAEPDFGVEAVAALTESQTALARGLEAMSAEMMALARTGVTISARSATGLLGARSWSDALALGADLTRAGFDAAAGGSARMAELGARLALDSTQPFVSRLRRRRSAALSPSGG